MPPRDNESEPALVSTTNFLPITVGEDKQLSKNGSDRFWSQGSGAIVAHLPDPTCLPPEVRAALENLLEPAKTLDDFLATLENGCTIMKACRVSVRDTMSTFIDEVTVLSEGSDTREFVANGIALSLHRARQFIATIEAIAAKPINRNLEARLQKSLESRDNILDESPLRLSASSPSLAFELRVKSSNSGWTEELSSESLPLSVSVEPILFARAADILAGSTAFESYQQCHVQIEYCRHKALGYSTGCRSGMIGEALVRVIISEGLGSEAQQGAGKKKSLPVWGRHDDVSKFRIVEARA
jgi:hypothetical protein